MVEVVRPLKRDERELIAIIANASHRPVQIPPPGTDVRVLDGGMGSLSFDLHKEEAFGDIVGAREFVDTDGVPVIASVYIDRKGAVYELDLFKVDYSPVGRISLEENPNPTMTRPPKEPL